MKGSARVAVSASVLVAAFLSLRFLTETEAVPIARPLDSFPRRISDWTAAEGTLFSKDVLAVLKPTDYLMRRYVHASGASIWLYIGYWSTQRKGAQVHSPKNCLPGGGWQPLEAARVGVPVGSNETIEVNQVLLQKDAEQQMVAYWYQARGEATASEIGGKIAMVKNALLHNRTDGAVIRVSSVDDGRPVKSTTPILYDFVRVIHPKLGDFLPD